MVVSLEVPLQDPVTLCIPSHNCRWEEEVVRV